MIKREPCIYKIGNLIDGKVYIGQTNQSFNARKTSHKSSLKRNKHYNLHLQRAWNKYGEENFIFEEIKKCSEYELDQFEIYFIEKYNSCNKDFGYNIDVGGGSLKRLSQETIEKIAVKKRVKVILINTKETFDSAEEASSKYKVSTSSISMCCKGDRNFAGRLFNGEWMVWKFLSEYDENEKHEFKQNKRANNKKKITCLNTKEVFNTINEAASKYEVERRAISKVLNGWQKTCLSPNYGRLQFAYGDSEENAKDLEPLKVKRKILCLTTNRVFESFYEATKTYNISSQYNLNRCLKGENRYCGKLEDGTKLKWAYYDEHLSI